MLDEQIERIENDVGGELKETAKRIYRRAFWIWLITTIAEVISVIAVVIDDDDLIGLLIALPFGVLIEWFITMGIAYMIMINLYAKGEIVDLLKVQNSELQLLRKGNNTVVVPNKPETKPDFQRFQPLDGGWVCKNCGTTNKKTYGQCKQCGVNRGGVAPVAETNVPKPAVEVKVAKEETLETKMDTKNRLGEKMSPLTQKLQNGVDTPVVEEFWTCSECGTKNKRQYGQCKQCGSYRK